MREQQPHSKAARTSGEHLVCLVIAIVIRWIAIYMAAALDWLWADGHDVRSEVMARLSPLGCDHVNMREHYALIRQAA